MTGAKSLEPQRRTPVNKPALTQLKLNLSSQPINTRPATVSNHEVVNQPIHKSPTPHAQKAGKKEKWKKRKKEKKKEETLTGSAT